MAEQAAVLLRTPIDPADLINRMEELIEQLGKKV
jgi:hypothetical protein